MANEISIRLSSFSDFTAVNVDGLGIIKVKKESSNQGARRSEIVRDIFKLQDEAKTLNKKMEKLQKEGKGENDPEFEKLESKAATKLDAITQLQTDHQKLVRSRLSDDEGGKLVDLLFEHASDEDISRLLALEGTKEEDGQEADS